MPITLCFHGGLFTVLPGCGTPMKVDVHMRMPEQVKAFGPNKKRLPDLEGALSAASRIDFEAKAALKPEVLPIRHISHLIPVDYQGFHKVVGFTGGTVTGAVKSVERTHLLRLKAAKQRGNTEEMLAEFERFSGVAAHHNPDQKYLQTLVQHFYDRLSAKELRLWTHGYCVEVKLPAAGTKVVLNGVYSKAQSLAKDTRIEFPVDPKSTIPHYPLNNPHVLEQPPTI